MEAFSSFQASFDPEPPGAQGVTQNQPRSFAFIMSMPQELEGLSHPSIQQWETASDRLMKAASTYLNSCMALEASSRLLEPRDLGSRLDHQLGAVYEFLEYHINHSRSILAGMRNKQSTTIYSLPEEILSEIFCHFVFERDYSRVVHLEHDVRDIYRRLYTILSVCSVWRKFGVSNGRLWSLVPIIPLRNSNSLMMKAAELSSQRSGGRKLHLAATTGIEVGPNVFEVVNLLLQNRSRFQTVNIIAKHPLLMRNIILPLVTHDASNTLTELSLCRLPTSPPTNRFPQDSDYITFMNRTLPDSINSITQSLRVLRAMNVHIHWQHVSLTQLVEMRVQSIMLGYNLQLYQLLSTLSSAPRLRKLEIISVTTHPTPNKELEPNTAVSLPSLEVVYLEDLFSDALSLVLSTIAPGSYRISLNLTINTFLINEPADTIWDGHLDLPQLAHGVAVETLMLDQPRFEPDWAGINYIRATLRALPSVTTLKLHRWVLDEDKWASLTPPSTLSGVLDFPRLRNIQISNARIVDTTGFERLIRCHPVHQLVLGASMPYVSAYAEDEVEWSILDGSENIVQWLERNVPNFRLVTEEIFEPPEFLSHQSQEQLW